MQTLTHEIIRNKVARSEVVCTGDENLFFLGGCKLESEDPGAGEHTCSIDGA